MTKKQLIQFILENHSAIKDKNEKWKAYYQKKMNRMSKESLTILSEETEERTYLKKG